MRPNQTTGGGDRDQTDDLMTAGNCLRVFQLLKIYNLLKIHF